MNFHSSRQLLLIGAVLFSSAVVVASPASAQQRANPNSAASTLLEDCNLTAAGCGTGLGAARAAAPKGGWQYPGTREEFYTFVAKEGAKQKAIEKLVERRIAKAITAVTKHCDEVSPNQFVCFQP